jgi:hypothetical protein
MGFALNDNRGIGTTEVETPGLLEPPHPYRDRVVAGDVNSRRLQCCCGCSLKVVADLSVGFRPHTLKVRGERLVPNRSMVRSGSFCCRGAWNSIADKKRSADAFGWRLKDLVSGNQGALDPLSFYRVRNQLSSTATCSTTSVVMPSFSSLSLSAS